MGGKRPRIKRNSLVPNLVEDTLKYNANKSTERARFIIRVPNPIQLSLWYDKHYVDRSQLGDENGLRKGIDSDTVQTLITDCFHHLFYYSSTRKDFKFLNHEEDNRALRIVLQKSNPSEPTLNVSVEVHFVDFDHYEITVITAMCTDSFHLFDGQYVLEFLEKDSSVLKRFTRNTIVEITSCQT